MRLKRWISFLMAALMLLSLFPSSAVAYSATYNYTGPQPTEIINSGTCPAEESSRNSGRHQWFLMYYDAPTCTEPGIAHYNCAFCDDFMSQQFASALGHDWTSWTLPDEEMYGCMEEVVEYRFCNRCGMRETRSRVRGHEWGDWKVNEKPTCEKQGLDYRICDRCGEAQWRYTDALGHDWDAGKVVKEPNCTVPGQKLFTCKRDASHTRTESIPVEPSRHDWDSGKITTPATCTTPGVLTYTCKNNSSHTRTEPIPSTSHDWREVSHTDPDCGHEGETVYQCQNCGQKMTEHSPASGDHHFGPWTPQETPNCAEGGTESRTCTVCGYVEWRGVPPKDHQWGPWYVAEEPGPLHWGKEERVCENCGAKEERPIPPENDPVPAVHASLMLKAEVDPKAGEGKLYAGAHVRYDRMLTNTGNVPVYVSMGSTYLSGEYTDASGNPVAGRPEVSYFSPDLNTYVPGYMLLPGEHFRFQCQEEVLDSDVSHAMVQRSIADYYTFVNNDGEAEEDITNSENIDIPLTEDGDLADASVLLELDIAPDAGKNKAFEGAVVYFGVLLTNTGSLPVYVGEFAPVTYVNVADRPMQEFYRPDLGHNALGYLLNPGEKLRIQRQVVVEEEDVKDEEVSFATRKYFYYEAEEDLWMESTTNWEDVNIPLTLEDPENGLLLSAAVAPENEKEKGYDYLETVNINVTMTNKTGQDLYFPTAFAEHGVAYKPLLLKNGESTVIQWPTSAIDSGDGFKHLLFQGVGFPDKEPDYTPYSIEEAISMGGIASNQAQVDLLMAKKDPDQAEGAELTLTAIRTSPAQATYAEGDQVTFHITVTNTGKVTLADTTIQCDPRSDGGLRRAFQKGFTWTDSALEPGESWEADDVIDLKWYMFDEANKATFNWVATCWVKELYESSVSIVTGEAPGLIRSNNVSITLNDDATTDEYDTLGLALSVQQVGETKPVYEENDQVEFEAKLTANGTLSLVDVIVFAQVGDEVTEVWNALDDQQEGFLAAGDSVVFSFPYTITKEDVARDHVSFKWFGQGEVYGENWDELNLAPEVKENFDGFVFAEPERVILTLPTQEKEPGEYDTLGLSLSVKQVSEIKTVYEENDTVDFQITVTNTGTLDLVDVVNYIESWNSDLSLWAVLEAPIESYMKSGESVTITFPYTITKEDAARGYASLRWASRGDVAGADHWDELNLPPEILAHPGMAVYSDPQEIIFTLPVKTQGPSLFLKMELDPAEQKEIYEQTIVFKYLDYNYTIINNGSEPLKSPGLYNNACGELADGVSTVLQPGESYSDTAKSILDSNYYGYYWAYDSFIAMAWRMDDVAMWPDNFLDDLEGEPVWSNVVTFEFPLEHIDDTENLILQVIQTSPVQTLYEEGDVVEFDAALINHSTFPYGARYLSSYAGDSFGNPMDWTTIFSDLDGLPLGENEEFHCKATYKITKDDADRGFVSMIFFGSADFTEDPWPVLVNDSNYEEDRYWSYTKPEEIIIQLPVKTQGPSLFLDVKQTSPEKPVYHLSDEIDLTYTLTNNGSVPLKTPTYFMRWEYDGSVWHHSKEIVLEPGDYVQFTDVAQVWSEDVSMGFMGLTYNGQAWLTDATDVDEENLSSSPNAVHSNEVYKQWTTEETEGDENQYDFENLTLTVDQTSPIKGAYSEGETITFHVEMVNGSSFDYAGSYVEGYYGDPVADTWGNLPYREGGPLIVADSFVYDETYTISKEDAARGYVTLEWYGYATFDDNNWPHLPPDAPNETWDFTDALPSPVSITLPVAQEGPALFLEAHVTYPQPYYHYDEKIKVEWKITNVGSETLSTIYLFNGPWEVDAWEDYNLAPGLSVTGDGFFSYAKDDVEASGGYAYINLEAYGYPYDPEKVGFTRWGEDGAGQLSDEDVVLSNMVHITLPFLETEEGASLYLEVQQTSPVQPVYYLNDHVSWDVILTNTGSVPLKLPTYFFEWTYDHMIVYTEHHDIVLAPGESTTFHDYSDVWQEDVDAGYMSFNLYGQAWLEDAEMANVYDLSDSANAVQSNVGTLYFPTAKRPEEESGASLKLDVEPKYPKPAYALDSNGMTEEIPYTLTVTNIGDAPLEFGIYQVNRSYGPLSFAEGPVLLYPKETYTFDYFGTFFSDTEIIPGTESEGILGEVEISFQAWGMIPGSDKIGAESNPVTLRHKLAEGTPPDPSTFTVVKTETSAPAVDPNGYVENEVITYDITITNNTDETFPYVVVHDILYDNGYGSDEIEVEHGFQPHETRTVQFQYTVTYDDAHIWGMVKNRAYVTWDEYLDEDGKEEVKSYSNTVISPTAETAPEEGVTLIKSIISDPDNHSYYVVGETIKFQVVIKNNTDSDLYTITVIDSMAIQQNGTDVIGSFGMLAPNESQTMEFEYVVQDYDEIPGIVFNTATASAIDARRNQFYIVSNEVSAPVGKNSPLLAEVSIVKKEISSPGPDGYYEVGEYIDYEITIKNTGDIPVGLVQVFDFLKDPWTDPIATEFILNPNDERTYPFSYQVQPGDLPFEWVINQARMTYCPVMYADVMQGMRFKLDSNEVRSRVGKPVPPPPTEPGEGDSCVVTLLAKGEYASDYNTHYCAEHLKPQQQVMALVDAARTDAEILNAWTKAKEIWRAEVDEMYQRLTNAAYTAARVAIAEEKESFEKYLTALEAMLAGRHPDDPAKVAQEISEQLMNRCVELCYELNNAPGGRADSASSGSVGQLAITRPTDDCQRTIQNGRNGDDIRFRVNLCEAHGDIEKNILRMTDDAHTRADYTRAWTKARALWQLSLDQAFSQLYADADDAAKQALSDVRTALNQLLIERESMLNRVYPNCPEIVAEMMSNLIKDCVVDACGEW